MSGSIPLQNPARNAPPVRWCAVLALAAGTAAAQQAPASPPISPAEQAVFQDPHLHNVRLPAQLRYEFRRSGSQALATAFQDEVTLQLGARAGGGCCTAQGRFLSGVRAMSLPELDDAQSNPVTLFFLEREVRELQRATGGQAAHFRRRIRLALADAQVANTTIRYDGRELDAMQITIAPYLDDPQRARFERQAATRYQFTLSRHVPGGVYRIRTFLPPAADAKSAHAQPADAAPLTEETLTLQPAPRS
jgi:hypothetical protein